MSMEITNNKKISFLINLFLIALMVVLPNIVMAQGAPPATPIDGGLSLLLASGTVYGVNKIRNHRKEK